MLMRGNMKNRYWIYRRRKTWYIEDVQTGKQESLHTKERQEAERLRQARNEAAESPALNLALGRTYLAAYDSQMAARTWSDVMTEMSTRGERTTQERCQRAMRSRPFDLIRHKKLIETNGKDLLDVIRTGPSSTNHFLRRLHNLAVGLGWLPWAVLASKLWPKVESKPKRAVTEAEHRRIIQSELNAERRDYYELLWETGASQSDAANLTADNMQWPARILRFARSKTGEVCTMRIGRRLEGVLKRLPTQGALFPGLSRSRATDRSGEFRRRCRILGIKGITLHSYRYAWAQRAKAAGYESRWAQAALGHSSRAVHEAYARDAVVTCPSLEEYEDKVIAIEPHLKQAVARRRRR